ncbi:MAG: PfkB family carbohydrate kinase [Sciscionella sp.]
MNLTNLLRTQRILAIVRGTDPAAALRTVLTLAEEGIEAIEVSLTTEDAINVIGQARERLGTAAALGAGTVLTVEDATRAVEAGASYLVTPALGDDLGVGAGRHVPVVTGAFTPSEVAIAARRGAAAVKLFPASLGGPAYLRALRDVFPAVPFVPVGGIGEGAARDYLAEGVDVSHAATDGSGLPTGLLLFEPRIADLVRVSYYRSGSAGSMLAPGEVVPALTAGIRVLHLTGITPALGASAAEATLSTARRARELGITVCFDVNYRGKLWSATEARRCLRRLVPDTDILVASEDELALVAEDPDAAPEAAALTLLTLGVSEVVIKQGASGATAITSQGKLSVPARPVLAVDPVGAGDAFVSGYLSG